MRKGYLQIPLAAEAQEVYTIANLEGQLTPTHVPQGVLNVMAYFQGVMTELLAGLNLKGWVNDIVWWGSDGNNLDRKKTWSWFESQAEMVFPKNS